MTTPGDPQDFLSDNHEVDAEHDLTGLGALAALAAVEAALIEAAAAGHAKIWLRFAPAVPGGGETLFQPVGRALKAAIAEGRIVRAMPARRGGWIARLKA